MTKILIWTGLALLALLLLRGRRAQAGQTTRASQPGPIMGGFLGYGPAPPAGPPLDLSAVFRSGECSGPRGTCPPTNVTPGQYNWILQ